MLAWRKVRSRIYFICLSVSLYGRLIIIIRTLFNPLPLPGVIRTALANMDREVKGEYQVLIQAKDMGGQLGGLASTTTINITLSDVNDNPPRFAKSKKVSVMMSDWFIVWLDE